MLSKEISGLKGSKWGHDVASVEGSSKAEPGAMRTDIFKFFEDVSAPLELKMLFVLRDSRDQPLAVCWNRNISQNTQPLNLTGFSLRMGKDNWYFKRNKMTVAQARKGDHKTKLPWFHSHATLEQEIAAQLTSE